jgi:hypothetical protein
MQVVMVRKYINKVRTVFAVISPVFKRFNNNKKLLIVRFVIFFGGIKFPRIKYY